MPPFRFSTDGFPPNEKIAAWRELFGQKITRLDMEPPRDQPFRGEALLRVLPNLAIGSIASTSNRIARTPHLVADGSDDIMLGIMLSGQARVSQPRFGEAIIGAGEAVVWSNASAGESDYPEAIEFLSLSIPRATLGPNLVHPHEAGISVIPAQSDALRLLTGYLQVLLREDLPPDIEQLSAEHIHDLVATTLGATRDAAEIAKGRGIRAARLRAIKADIIANLGRHDLNGDWLAARHAISPRYIRALFDSEQTTLTDFVLGQRLARAHRMLAQPRFAQWTISSIAFDSGFGDLSYFNRCFRLRYGVTPSDVRAKAKLDGK